MNLTICERLSQLREDHDIQQKQIAHTIGVRPTAVCRWDAGRVSPRVAGAVAYAAVLGYRIAARRCGRVIAIGYAAANLALLRQADGLSQSALARRMQAEVSLPRHLEKSAGPTSSLATVQRYVEALGYEVVLAPKATPCGCKTYAEASPVSLPEEEA